MVIDLDRCTRCDDCVRACASAHDNNPRFLRNGPAYGRYMVANACMHCQDPVCMIECPTGAIHRDLSRGPVVINDATCVGCTACANNCPYDAIRMVEVRDARGHALADSETNLPILKATKCDLCVDQRGGPACQRACPHDALKRVDMRDQGSFTGWLNR
jgi:Fe-S-cluster-containing dehydrogenase component